MKRWSGSAIAVAAGVLVTAHATGVNGVNAHDKEVRAKALHALWSSYQQAVANKDAQALLSMYVSPDVPVMGAFAPRSYAVVTAANKQPVPRTLLVTAKQDVVNEAKLPPDQTEHVEVHSDDEVGSISYDYRAKVGHGHIVWTVVQTNKGWKIASVVYSINVPAADRATGSS